MQIAMFRVCDSCRRDIIDSACVDENIFGDSLPQFGASCCWGCIVAMSEDLAPAHCREKPEWVTDLIDLAHNWLVGIG